MNGKKICGRCAYFMCECMYGDGRPAQEIGSCNNPKGVNYNDAFGVMYDDVPGFVNDKCIADW